MAEDLSGFSMLELFRLEAESQTAILSAGILAIEELQRSPETIESMMRAAHSLKGAARIVGLDPAVRVAHALEDCFVAADKGRFTVRPEHADLLLTATDFLATIARSDDALEPNGSAQKASRTGDRSQHSIDCTSVDRTNINRTNVDRTSAGRSLYRHCLAACAPTATRSC